MERRRFLSAALAAAAPPRIFDAHVHFYDPRRPRGVPWPPPDNRTLYRPVLPAECRALTKPLGVRGVLVVEASPWLEDNQWTLDLAARDPFLRGIIGHLAPGTPEFPAQLDRFRRNPRFLGIRIGGAQLASATQALLDDLHRLADAGLALDVLGGPAPYTDAARVSDRLPNLRMVLHHLPNEAARDAAALPEMAGRSNVYAKVSGVLRRGVTDPAAYREPLDALWTHFGSDRLLYASNWPVSDLVAPYPEVLRIVQTYVSAKPPEVQQRFFWQNAHTVYRMPR